MEWEKVDWGDMNIKSVLCRAALRCAGHQLPPLLCCKLKRQRCMRYRSAVTAGLPAGAAWIQCGGVCGGCGVWGGEGGHSLQGFCAPAPHASTRAEHLALRSGGSHTCLAALAATRTAAWLL